jgi:hypothetical protein
MLLCQFKPFEAIYDLQWLTSFLYNMGVHIVHTKFYEWLVSSYLIQQSKGTKCMDQSNILCDLVSKRCAKCLILGNNLVCNGQHLVGLEVLVASITH